jgi:hypothetical protein
MLLSYWLVALQAVGSIIVLTELLTQASIICVAVLMVLLTCLTRAALSAAGVLGEERPVVR